MNTSTQLVAMANYHILRRVLEWLNRQNVLPMDVLKHTDRLNAEKLGLSPGEVCGVWV